MRTMLAAAGAAALLSLTACSFDSEPPPPPTEVLVDQLCGTTEDGTRIVTEGYLMLPDEFTEDNLVIWVVSDPAVPEPLAGIFVPTGTGPNQGKEPDISEGTYHDEDIEVYDASGVRIPFGQKVRIEATKQEPFIGQDWGCRLDSASFTQID